MGGTKQSGAALADIFERYTSRRLLVFLASTGLLLAGSLSGEQWVVVAGMYLASDAGPKIAGALRGPAPG